MEDYAHFVWREMQWHPLNLVLCYLVQLILVIQIETLRDRKMHNLWKMCDGAYWWWQDSLKALRHAHKAHSSLMLRNRSSQLRLSWLYWMGYLSWLEATRDDLLLLVRWCRTESFVGFFFIFYPHCWYTRDSDVKGRAHGLTPLQQYFCSRLKCYGRGLLVENLANLPSISTQ
jgi:hypothetical protein